MATSGSVDFATSRDSLIKYALINIGALEEGGTPSATQLTNASVLLNMIVKAWMADGMPLWALKTGYIFPIHDVNSVLLGPTGGKAAITFDRSTIGSDEASGQTVITLADATGFAASDVIGVELDDGDMHWTTINGAPSGNDVTLTTALPSAAGEGNQVYAYPTSAQIVRPLRIIHAWVHDYDNNTDYQIFPVAKTEVFDFSNKEIESYPIQYAYDPQLTNGVFHFYPRFQNGNKVVNILYHRPFEDFDAANDEPDFPQEWYMALLWMLSWALAPSHGIPLQERRMLLMEAEKLKAEALSNGQEQASLYIAPNTDTGWRREGMFI